MHWREREDREKAGGGASQEEGTSVKDAMGEKRSYEKKSLWEGWDFVSSGYCFIPEAKTIPGILGHLVESVV